MYLVWLHLKLDEQVLALVSRVWSSKIARLQALQLQIFLSFFVLSSAKSVIPNFFFFFTYVVFAQILIKIMHVCIVYMYI
jgi:hypothetical protein